MNAGRDVERLTATWLAEEAPGRAPDRILAVAARVIDRTSQRRRIGVIWGDSTVFTMWRLAAAAAIVLAVGLGIATLRPTGNIGGAASPSPSMTPVPTIPSPGPRPIGLGTPAPVVPASPLPNPPGDPLPTELVGRTYAASPPEIQGTQWLILTLRAADDPHCAAMFEGRSTCFTYLWTPNYPAHVADPAARGSARMSNGQLVLSFDIVPNDLPCVGQKAVYAIADAGATLTGVATPDCTVPGFTAITVPAD